MFFPMPQTTQGDALTLKRTPLASTLLRSSKRLALMWPMKQCHQSARISTCSAMFNHPSCVEVETLLHGKDGCSFPSPLRFEPRSDYA